MRPQMTRDQADALAAYLVALRPGQHAWKKPAILSALAQAATRTNDTELLTRAAVRAALTASIRTPSVIGMDGAHWDAVGDMDRSEPTRGSRHEKPEGCGGIHAVGAPCGVSNATPPPADLKDRYRAALSIPIQEGYTP